jgi:hypothetical protein
MGAGDDNTYVRSLDLCAAITLESGYDDPDSKLHVLDAIRQAEAAAAVAARTGVIDTARTAYATLALAQLGRGEAGQTAARSAAVAAARSQWPTRPDRAPCSGNG